MAKAKRTTRTTKRSTTVTAPAKLQRWVDLLAAMLSRAYPATFEELQREVPAYAAGQGASLMRMFERDKDELRAFGVPIETVTTSDGAQSAYRLRRQDFYLPFIAMATSGPAAARSAKAAEGYRMLAQLAFEPDELHAVAAAAARVRQLGDPSLATDADQAMRKLAFDLPPDALRESSDERVLAEPVDDKVFSVLARALLDRKVVTFDYHSMSSDETQNREAEPYGLAFLGSHWYLVARDRMRGELRTFRVSRISRLVPNRARAQTPDYEVPGTFKLAEHARSRQAWALGGEQIIEAVVEFNGSSGATKAAAKLGESVGGAAKRRRFQVHRLDTFARWLMGFAGEAVPIEPPELVERFQSMARETLDVYGDAQ
jgi:proteasome accessory factor B